MLKIFRTDITLQIVIVIAVLVAMWLPGILQPVESYAADGGCLYLWLTGWLSPTAANIVGMALTLLGGILLVAMLHRSKMIHQGTFLPMLFFVVAMSLGRDHTTLTPFLLGSFFMIGCVGQLMITSTLLSPTLDKIFLAAALLSTATLFCTSMVVFLVPLMLCMFNYSLYTWRDWTMILLGIIAPYIPIEVYHLLSGRLFYENYLLYYQFTTLHFQWTAQATAWVMSLVFLLLLLVAWGKTAAIAQSSVVNFTKNTTAISIFLIGSILFGAYHTLIPLATPAYALPFAFACTTFFYDPKKKEWLWDLLLVVILAAAIAYNL